MSKKILVINAGSSSLKYQLMNMKDESVIAKGLVERIGIEGSCLKHKPTGKEPVTIEQPINDHTKAIEYVLKALTDAAHGVVESMSEIDAVGHRVVHGGESFQSSALITADVLNAIKENASLAPLHNPANIMGIEACEKVLPGVPMVAVFDTAFHQGMPARAFMYALPYECYTQKKIRRYGFHGTSHKYVARRMAEIMDKPIEDLKIITCHLGNGSSIAAVKGGKSIDTSMGFTPLEGLPMGTRTGSLDPAIIFHLIEEHGMTPHEVNVVMNKESGVQGISGVSSDFRDLEKASNENNERAKLAVEMFCYSVKKFIGSYAVAMEGVDCLVFTAGVGENDSTVREMSTDGLEFLGIKINKELNKGTRGKEIDISAPDSKVKVYIIPTDEELMIARDTLKHGFK